jgi:succinyl-CoA synthetase beta subunit
LTGFIEGLRETEKELGTKFDFPIVIRRGGPRVEEAYKMLKKVKDFDLHLQGEETSIAQSAKSMAELAEKYALSEGNKK